MSCDQYTFALLNLRGNGISPQGQETGNGIFKTLGQGNIRFCEVGIAAVFPA